MMRTPPSHQAQCFFCSDDIDTRTFGIFQFTAGWLEQRRRGGANAVALPQRLHYFACATCIDRLRHNISPAQRSIFDELTVEVTPKAVS